MVFRRRLLVLMVLAAAGSAAVWLRVAWLQVVTAEHWQELARRAALRTIELDPPRGTIVDAEGALLVEDAPVFQLVLVPAEWKRRDRVRCESCGTLHFRDPLSERPLRARCCKSPDKRLSRLGAGDLGPLEALLRLPHGALAERAWERQVEIDKLVKAEAQRLEAQDGDDFLVKDRLRIYRENRESLPITLVDEVDDAVIRLLSTDEAGVTYGLRLRPAHKRVARAAGPLARVLGQAGVPDGALELNRARAAHPGDDIDAGTVLGKSGLERCYDDRLRGRPGRELRARGGDGDLREPEERQPAVPGRTLRLAASAGACDLAQRCLASLPFLEDGYAPRTRASGALIAMRADTGEIVALAELPEWRPPTRRPAWLAEDAPDVDVVPLADRELLDWVPARPVLGAFLAEDAQRTQVARSSGFARLMLPWRLRETRLEAWDPVPPGLDVAAWRRALSTPAGDLLSRVSQIAVEPGSTMKIFIGLGMLESGLPLPGPVPFPCDGHAGRPACHDHPDADFEDAICYSCNQYFAYSLRNFSSHWPTYSRFVGAFIDRLGLGHKTGSDLDGEARGRWLRAREWQPGEEISIDRDSGQMVAIGQGEVTATPLQMVRAVALFGNGGRLVTPHLGTALEGPQDGTAERMEPVEPLEFPSIDLGIAPANLARVREGMRRVVTQGGGTAQRKFDWDSIPARIYAKTGTAQVSTDWRPWHPGETSRVVTHQWFVGLAEADGRPPLAFAVVYHARTESAAGETAAKAAGAFLQAWFAR